ncbi:MAG: hypothetical protein ACRET5_06195 [Steroidobacteraceae bacterium]
MSREASMPSARRRAVPGMTPSPAESPPPAAAEPGVPEPAPRPAPAAAASRAEDRKAATAATAPPPPASVRARPAERQRVGHQVEDYGTTRLANFRLPIDLHDHYKSLVREVETSYPKLRHPSLTEVIIALLAEGPHTPEGVAELIRRKRAAEHGGDR